MLRKFAISVTAVAALVFVPAASAAALPDETVWEDTGLIEMVRVSGAISWSIDGLGTNSGTGMLQVDKPADATVLSAYFIAAQTVAGVGSESGISLDGQPVTFSHHAWTGSGGTWPASNVLADVTDLVSSTIDDAPAGLVEIPVDEGAVLTEGTALIVIFQDPSVEIASFMLFFGRSDSAGDEFTLEFPPLTEVQVNDIRMSLGVSFSIGVGQVSTAHVNGQLLAEQIGHTDDCIRYDPANAHTCTDGELFTVGGVGDSLDNPVLPSLPWAQENDDELYNLSPFAEVDDTSIEVTTVNPSGDDNLFMAAFYMAGVGVTGAEPIGDPVDEGDEEIEPAEDVLPATGFDAASLAALAALLLAGGALVNRLAARRGSAT